MRDILFVTIDSVRWDFTPAMEFVSSFELVRGTAAGHYTRPSLASMHAGTYRSALRAEATSPTIAEALSEAGYTCIGFAANPQADPVFGFGDGYDEYENFYEAGSRGSRVREFLGEIGVLRRLYHRMFPPHAKTENLPTDERVVDMIIDSFRETDSPQFVWAHLNGAHRPYGRDGEGISRNLDRKALFAPNNVTAEEHSRIETAYEGALRRVDDQIRRLYEAVGPEPLFVLTSDHGDEFGEEGHYFHQPQRRRTADALLHVPVLFDGVDVTADRCSLVDIPPTICSAVGLKPPDAWDGHNLLEETTEETITIAPWNSKATVAWEDRERKIVSRDDTVRIEDRRGRTTPEATVLTGELQDRLRDLGYAE